MEIKRLDWDSDFFNIEIGELTNLNSNQNDIFYDYKQRSKYFNVSKLKYKLNPNENANYRYNVVESKSS